MCIGMIGKCIARVIIICILAGCGIAAGAQVILPPDQDGWTEGVENWRMRNNLAADADARVGKHSLKITAPGAQDWNHVFESSLPHLQDLSGYEYCYVWARRSTSSWIQLQLVDSAGRKWKHRLLTGVTPDWKLFEFQLNRKPTGEWAGVEEGFDFSRVKSIVFLFGAWQDTGVNIWIDGLYFSRFKGGVSPVGTNTYEAEDASLIGASRSYCHRYHTGDGFVAGFGRPGTAVEFTVGVKESGKYLLAFRYSNGFDREASRSIFVDDTKIGTVKLPSTRGWDEWGISTCPAEIDSGIHKIKISYEETDRIPINLDQLKVLPAGLPADETAALLKPVFKRNFGPLHQPLGKEIPETKIERYPGGGTVFAWPGFADNNLGYELRRYPPDYLTIPWNSHVEAYEEITAAGTGFFCAIEAYAPKWFYSDANFPYTDKALLVELEKKFPAGDFASNRDTNALNPLTEFEVWKYRIDHVARLAGKHPRIRGVYIDEPYCSDYPTNPNLTAAFKSRYGYEPDDRNSVLSATDTTGSLVYRDWLVDLHMGNIKKVADYAHRFGLKLFISMPTGINEKNLFPFGRLKDIDIDYFGLDPYWFQCDPSILLAEYRATRKMLHPSTRLNIVLTPGNGERGREYCANPGNFSRGPNCEWTLIGYPQFIDCLRFLGQAEDGPADVAIWHMGQIIWVYNLGEGYNEKEKEEVWKAISQFRKPRNKGVSSR